MAINPMEFSSKDTVLDVVRTEQAKFFKIVDNPEYWNVDTRCEGWEVRDMVGHMIDVTEGYLNRWDMARNGEYPDGIGLQVMGDTLNEGALALRSLSREQAIARLKAARDKMMSTFEGLSEDEWNNFLVAHKFMGSLPTLFYPAFHIMDYTVHSWDMEWGLGNKDARLDERSAGVLVPYMFILWQYTVIPEEAEGVNLTYGIKCDGEWGGQWKVTIKEGQFSAEPVADLGDVDAVLHFDHPSDLVLTAYQRIEGGKLTGSPEATAKVRSLFHTI